MGQQIKINSAITLGVIGATGDKITFFLKETDGFFRPNGKMSIEFDNVAAEDLREQAKKHRMDDLVTPVMSSSKQLYTIQIVISPVPGVRGLAYIIPKHR